MNDLTIPQELANKPLTLHQQSLDLVVCDQGSCEAAIALAGHAAGTVKKLEDFFDPNIATAHKLHKDLVAQKKKVIEPAQQAKDIAKSKALAWQQAEEEKRLAEQRRLQAEADLKARQERERLEAKAAAAKRPETVAKYEEAAAQVQAPVVLVPPPARIAGAVGRETWKAQIEDYTLLWQFIFANQRTDLVTINVKELERLAKAQQGQAKVPGVRFYVEHDLAVKSA
jgi:hypothetical protein